MSSSVPGSVSSASLPGSSPRGSGSRTHIWPNPLPLEAGVIRLLQQATKHGTGAGVGKKFQPHQLRKLLIYFRSKGKSCYPNVRFSNWLHVATSKFGIPEELAWVYFETFDVVSDIGARDRLELLDLTSKCATTEELNEFRKKLSVDTLQFILFLFLQNAPRSSLKTPMVAAEEWPSPESELRQKSSEHYHLMFLRANFQDLLELFQDSEHLLSEESVKALGFVFSAAKNLKECSLYELAVSAASHSGYSKVSKSFSLTQFEFWMRSLLEISPYGPYSLLSLRRELKPASCFHSDGSGRLLVNPMAPLKHRCSMLYRVSSQTLASCDEGLQDSNIYIRNCRRSNIYLLAPLKSVHIDKCSKCVLVLGTVSSSVIVSNCDSLTVIVACRRIHVSSSSTCVFHLLTMTRPLFLPASLHITLAPYNTHYPSLGTHLTHSGLSTNTNYWNSPIDLIGGAGTTDALWGLMPPDFFRPMEVPFDLPGTTEEIPYPLPPPYLQAMAVKKERLRQWYGMVRHTRLTKEQNKQLWTSVRDHFDEWLGSEGHKKELVDLGFKPSSIPTTTLYSQQANPAAALMGAGKAPPTNQQVATSTLPTR